MGPAEKTLTVATQQKALERRDSRSNKTGQGRINKVKLASFLKDFFFCLFVFLGPHPLHMGVPRLAVKLEL